MAVNRGIKKSAIEAEPVVRLRGVWKSFGDAEVVRDLDLDVGESEFFTILGSSGCGKTTTLRMIAGFEDPTSGELWIDNQDMAGIPAHRRPTNTVFQSYALFPNLSVFDNVAFSLARRKVAKTEIRDRVGRELERVGLEQAAGKRPDELSGGMQQRVALARALVNLPRVLLLDEPLGALDLKLRKSLQLELKRIQSEVGITFIYVTHDQEEALTMSDRVAIMKDGRFEQIGSPVDVYERPDTAFVADFIGASNLMPGRVSSDSGDLIEVGLECGVGFRAEGPGLRAGDECYAVVRPEKITVGRHSRPDAGAIEVAGTLEASAYFGSATRIEVTLREGTRMMALAPSSDSGNGPAEIAAGEEVFLSWLPENARLLAR